MGSEHRHVKLGGKIVGMQDTCAECAQTWPCDAIQLVAEVERLRGRIEDYKDACIRRDELIAGGKSEVERLRLRASIEADKVMDRDMRIHGDEGYMDQIDRLTREVEKWRDPLVRELTPEIERLREENAALREGLETARDWVQQGSLSNSDPPYEIICAALKSHPSSTEPLEDCKKMHVFNRKGEGMSEQTQPQPQPQSESIGGGSRQPASLALRDAAERLRRRADGLESIATALEQCVPKGRAGITEDSWPHIGVGSGAEVALWEWACSIR